MEKRQRCKDCKWLGGMVPVIKKYECRLSHALVRSHWLGCPGFVSKVSLVESQGERGRL